MAVIRRDDHSVISSARQHLMDVIK